MDEFAQRFERNVAALCPHASHVVDALLAHVDAFDLNLSPTADGGFVLTRDVDHRVEALSSSTPLADAVAFADVHIPGAPDYAPLLIVGLRAGYEVDEALRRLHDELGGRRQALYVVEPSFEIARAALHLHDWADALAENKMRLFVGPDSGASFIGLLREDPMKPVPRKIATLSTPDDAKRLATELAGVLKDQMDEAVALKSALDAHYAGCKDAWVDRGLRGEPLRVLLISSGFSQFVRFANRDIENALTRLGNPVRIIAEREREDRITGLAMLREIDRFRPDLIHHIDHGRWEAAAIYPPDLPFLTCVLDYFPSLENVETAAKSGDNDYFLGYVGHWSALGYRSERLFPLEPPVNENVFRPAARSDGSLDGLRCEVSYISNATRTPEEYFDDLRAKLKPHGEGAIRAAEALFEPVRARFLAGSPIYDEAEYAAVLDQTGAAGDLDPRARTLLVHGFLAHVGNAWFRQLPLIALSEAGVDLRLYGDGWERHPRLTRHAHGFAEHGEATSRIMNASLVNLHINQIALIHNRLIEALAAGAFVLSHRHRASNRLLDLEPWLFEGAGEVVEKVRHFLAAPQERAAQSETLRDKVLARYTYAVQYRAALTNMARSRKREFGAGDLDAALRKRKSRGVSLWNDLAARPASELYAQVTGRSAQTDGAEVYPEQTKPAAEALWLEDFLARAAAVESAGPANKRLWDGPAKQDADVGLVFQEHVMPDDAAWSRPMYVRPRGGGSFAVHDIPVIGDVNGDNAVWLCTSDGTLSVIARGPGLHAGAFDAAGRFVAPVLGERGIYEFENGKPRRLFDLPADALFLNAHPLDDGRVVLLDRTRCAISLHEAGGRLIRVFNKPDPEAPPRSPCVEGGSLYYIQSGLIHRASIDDPQKTVVFPPAPIGEYCQLSATRGIVAALTWIDWNWRKDRFIKAVRGLTFHQEDGGLIAYAQRDPYWRQAKDIGLSRSNEHFQIVMAEPNVNRCSTWTAVLPPAPRARR